MPSEIVMNEQAAGHDNAEILSRRLSLHETVIVPGGDLYVGTELVGDLKEYNPSGQVSFVFRGNGNQRYGKSATVIKATDDFVGRGDSTHTHPALLRIGGRIGKPPAGRCWHVSDMCFDGRRMGNVDCIGVYAGDSFSVERVSVSKALAGIRLRHHSRIVAGKLSLVQSRDNGVGIRADGNGPRDKTTHCSLLIDTFNSADDSFGIDVKEWYRNLNLMNCTVQGARHIGLLIRDGSVVNIIGSYIEKGKDGITLRIESGSQVSSTGLIARYLDIDDTSYLVAHAPSRVSGVSSVAPAYYGRLQSGRPTDKQLAGPPNGPCREEYMGKGGWTNFVGDSWVDGWNNVHYCIASAGLGGGKESVWETTGKVR